MRKIVANLFISLDGVVEAPHEWHFPYFDEEMGEAVGAAMADSDAMLLGRVTYEEFASYWPHQADDAEGAQHMNQTPKYVLSSTLSTVEWQHSTLVRGDVATELRKLKEQPGKDISIVGSPTVVRTLLAAGLVDELRLLVHPIVVGDGKKKLFDGSEPQVPLRLADSKTFKTGVLSVTYVPAV